MRSLFFGGDDSLLITPPGICSVGPNDPGVLHPEEKTVHKLLSGGGVPKKRPQPPERFDDQAPKSQQTVEPDEFREEDRPGLAGWPSGSTPQY